jgi:cell division protein ZapA
MSSEARSTSVHILGQEYRIRSTEGAEFMKEVAIYVDEARHDVSSRMTTGTTTQIAVLAALNIAEELFRERRNGHAGPDPELDARVRHVLSRLDEVLGAVPSKSPAGSS